MLTQQQIRLWVPPATQIFQRYMPPIAAPYPKVYIASRRTHTVLREKLISQTGNLHTSPPEDSIMEYIHGNTGNAILIRQDLLPDENDEHFCWMYWHELGHFYAISSEITNLHRYNDPSLVDDSSILDMSPERVKQEGYWFWQEFIAQAISNHVSYKHRSTERDYHPEQIDWCPEMWGGIVERLMDLLDATFWHYPTTIDEYSLAHYFALLLKDDFAMLYCKAAVEGKLRVFGDRNGREIYPAEKIEPTCISDMVDVFQPPLWRMKALLDEKLSTDLFWSIDEGFLLELGKCVGALMIAKLKLLAELEC